MRSCQALALQVACSLLRLVRLGAAPRARAAGRAPQREPYMELRDTSKIRERDNL
jgi:hypothetical protein